jgi:hypothetical protein
MILYLFSSSLNKMTKQAVRIICPPPLLQKSHPNAAYGSFALKDVTIQVAPLAGPE